MKFRRKSASSAPATDPGAAAAADPAPEEQTAEGPFDLDELPDDGVDRVDLGSLLVAPDAERALRMQVDEKTGAVQAVILAGADGALELRAFAAPRHGDLWSELRPQIAADMARRGGTATEREGRFGPELLCEITVRRGEGTATQPSRFIGVNGPRWMLRATLIGRPAVDAEAARPWEDALARVAVRRGSGPMPVGEALPVELPEGSRRLAPRDAARPPRQA